MSSTAEPGELVTGAGVAPLVSLRVGMRFDTAYDVMVAGLPDKAALVDADEYVRTVGYAERYSHNHDWPMVLIYIPSDYTGPVDNGPEDAVGGTESAGGQVVAGTGTPTQGGYRQMMRQRSMAAHPAGKARG